MKSFEVHGTFRMGDRMQKFTKIISGMNEKSVIEKLYCDLGSRHRVKRNNIKIIKIEEIKNGKK